MNFSGIFKYIYIFKCVCVCVYGLQFMNTISDVLSCFPI